MFVLLECDLPGPPTRSDTFSQFRLTTCPNRLSFAFALACSASTEISVLFFYLFILFVEASSYQVQHLYFLNYQ
jgi:hypothetical protein